TTARRAGPRYRCGPARRWPRPSRCSPSWTPRWWTRNSPGSARDHVPEAERSMVTAPAQPSPLPRPALDSHTHLDMMGLLGGPEGRPPGKRTVSEVVALARAAGLGRIVAVGTDLESSRWSACCADEHDGVYAAVAIHPNETQAVSAEVGAGAPAPGSSAADEVL